MLKDHHLFFLYLRISSYASRRGPWNCRFFSRKKEKRRSSPGFIIMWFTSSLTWPAARCPDGFQNCGVQVFLSQWAKEKKRENLEFFYVGPHILNSRKASTNFEILLIECCPFTKKQLCVCVFFFFFAFGLSAVKKSVLKFLWRVLKTTTTTLKEVTTQNRQGTCHIILRYIWEIRGIKKERTRNHHVLLWGLYDSLDLIEENEDTKLMAKRFNHRLVIHINWVSKEEIRDMV